MQIMIARRALSVAAGRVAVGTLGVGTAVAVTPQKATLVTVSTTGKATGALVLVSQTRAGHIADGPSHGFSISANGRWVGAQSQATNLIAGTRSAGGSRGYVKDLDSGRLTR